MMEEKNAWTRRDQKPYRYYSGKEKYFELLGITLEHNDNRTQNKDKDINKAKEALLQAHEIRRFEIQHFWARSTFFWVFIAFIFTAYCSIVYGYISSADQEKHFIAQSPLAAFLGLSTINLIGITLSYIWYKVVESSKYWQENWEAHIDMLEGAITGHLHKVMLLSEKPLLSVSKLCELLSIASIVTWFILQFISTYGFSQKISCAWFFFLLYFISIIVLRFLLKYYYKSSSIKCLDNFS